MEIAVVGAGGRVGREVTDILKNQGHEIVEVTRSAGVDVHTGTGLAEALSGVEAVIDAVNIPPSPDTDVVTGFFRTTARNLQRAAAAAGVRRIVLVSIIGIDEFTSGHYAGKLAQERALLEGPVPVRIVRAAQFHEFPAMMLEWTTQGDVARVPAMRTQLVAVRTVAEKLAEIAVHDGPAMTDIAGPEEIRLSVAAAEVARRRGYPARVEEVADTSDPNHGLQATGALLPGPDAVIAGPTFAEWLTRR
ncbi:SDR family oxidoreductase [Allokutzneria albata]|uniref:SDR family oxidoreductase n=1 Tax=Allokutzneria albata TaxID=211114 RepID=UPI0004C3E8E0|nr:NAD(P)H-binding protein [Allokutzneria albata]